MMATVLIISIVLMAIALIGTIYVSKENEKNYGEKTKGNVYRLSYIYIISIVISIIAVGIYIALK